MIVVDFFRLEQDGPGWPILNCFIRNVSVGKERIIEITKASKNLFQKLRQKHIKDEIVKIWQL